MRRISKALGLLLLLALSAASGRRMPSDADLPRPPAGGDSYPAPADDFVLPYDEPTADPDDWVLPADDDPVPPFEPTPDDTPAYPDVPAEDAMPAAPADEPVPVGGIIRDISATLHVSLLHALPLDPLPAAAEHLRLALPPCSLRAVMIRRRVPGLADAPAARCAPLCAVVHAPGPLLLLHQVGHRRQGQPEGALGPAAGRGGRGVPGRRQRCGQIDHQDHRHRVSAASVFSLCEAHRG